MTTPDPDYMETRRRAIEEAKRRYQRQSQGAPMPGASTAQPQQGYAPQAPQQPRQPQQGYAPQAPQQPRPRPRHSAEQPPAAAGYAPQPGYAPQAPQQPAQRAPQDAGGDDFRGGQPNPLPQRRRRRQVPPAQQAGYDQPGYDQPGYDTSGYGQQPQPDYTGYAQPSGFDQRAAQREEYDTYGDADYGDTDYGDADDYGTDLRELGVALGDAEPSRGDDVFAEGRDVPDDDDLSAFVTTLTADESDYEGTAETFADDQPNVPRGEQASSNRVLASSGFKGWMNNALGTKLAASPGSVDYQMAMAERAMNAKLSGTRVVAVMGAKGGVGKTITVHGLGNALSNAKSRGGVLAMDLDITSTLAMRAAPPPGGHVNSSVAALARAYTSGALRAVSDVERHVSVGATGFGVVPGPRYSGDGVLYRDELKAALQAVSRHYSLILLDFPASPELPLALHALNFVDHIVYVVETTRESLKTAYVDLVRLRKTHGHLVNRATIILNSRSAGSKGSPEEEDRFVARVRKLVVASEGTGIDFFDLAYDPHIGESEYIEWDQLALGTRERFDLIGEHVVKSLATVQTPETFLS